MPPRPRVDRVTTIGRHKTGQAHPKLREIERQNLWDYSDMEEDLKGFDAGFFCLGVASAGKSEADYKRITRDIPVAAGKALARLNPNLVFVFVSGSGTDGTEKGRIMWARVKGQAENALLQMPFRAAYMFRPGIIRPLHRIRSRTRLYRYFYALAGWTFPILNALFPNALTSTERIGKAMINAVDKGYSKRILHTAEINELAE